VALCREIRQAFTETDIGWELTVTLPMPYLTMRYFNIDELKTLVDFFNVMTYDVHGPWDQPSLWNGETNLVRGHTNLTDISAGLDLLWRNGVTADKVVMGMTFMARGLLLKDTTCSKPGTCLFQGAAFPSDCSTLRGIYSYQGKDSILRSLY